MTNKITESAIEKFAIELLKKSGYQYIYAPSIAPDSETPERKSFEDDSSTATRRTCRNWQLRRS